MEKTKQFRKRVCISKFVEISSAPVEISSELVEISSELVWLIWKLLIISVFIRTRNAVMRRHIPLAHVCSTEFWVFAFIRLFVKTTMGGISVERVSSQTELVVSGCTSAKQIKIKLFLCSAFGLHSFGYRPS